MDISGTVRERAARELRDRILTGALPAGSRVDLDAITEEFATSRTPVREALLELSFEGLVEVAPRSGITVIGISPDDVLDSFTILGVRARNAQNGYTSVHLPTYRDIDGTRRSSIRLLEELREPLSDAVLEFLVDEGLACRKYSAAAAALAVRR